MTKVQKNASPPKPPDLRRLWLVAANHDNIDKTTLFIQNGNWELDPKFENTTAFQVACDMQVGDLIAIKSFFIQKKDLPFLNPANVAVPGLSIKSLGTITKIEKQGLRVLVSWEQNFQRKDWYFLGCNRPVHLIEASKSIENASLIDYLQAVKSEPSFLNLATQHCYLNWLHGKNLSWIPFYKKIATQLVHEATPIPIALERIRSALKTNPEFSNLIPPKDDSQTSGFDPFSFFTLFNRSIDEDEKVAVANGIAKALSIDVQTPTVFLVFHTRKRTLRFSQGGAPIQRRAPNFGSCLEVL